MVVPAEPLPDDGIGEFDYGFILDDSGTVLPDPRSRRQPDGARVVADLRCRRVRLVRPEDGPAANLQASSTNCISARSRPKAR